MNNLYIKQKVFKITDHYQVFNENQDPLYQVDQDFKMIGNTVHVSDPNGKKLFVVDREVLTFLPKFNVHFSDGGQASIKSQFTFFKKKIDIISDHRQLQANGNFWDYSFEITDGDVVVATIQKTILAWSDTYQITVYEPKLEQLILASVIAIDNIKDMEESR